MGQKEGRLISAILNNPEPGEILFRANAGFGWSGEIVKKTRDTITLKNPRPFKGQEEGFSDLFGWTEKIITADMVGKNVAVFTVKEVKTGKLKATDKQKAFIKKVNDAGGIGEVVKVGD